MSDADVLPGQESTALASLFSEAIAWGRVYGEAIPAHQWDAMRIEMSEKFSSRAVALNGDVAQNHVGRPQDPEGIQFASAMRRDEVLGLGASIVWPKAKDVGRIEDMGQGHIRVGLDADNDVFVSVWGDRQGASVEFCNPGGGGGGKSRRTRMALIALMVAMEADNAEIPSRDWWAVRNGVPAAKP